ncbi:MAG: peroxiredoxin [Fretibacterium sp.]|nr:peroxiredoxin [Fretibacterium sp.]
MLKTNSPFPPFALPDQTGALRTETDFSGQWTVFYFYPKDNTSGCSAEAQSFAELFEEFRALNAIIVGISPDNTKSHEKFAAKLALPFLILSDTEHTLLTTCGVWQKKKMYGREYMGVIRTTALMDPQGLVVELWEKVKVPGHAEAVLAKLKEHIAR